MAREFILFFILTGILSFSFATDILTPSHPLSNGETLISKNKTFALGFFTPPNSNKTYLAIWLHNIPNQTVIWIANRQNPITNLNATLSLSPTDASLHIKTPSNPNPIWSSPSLPTPIPPIALLLDTGNLLIKTLNSTSPLWQSFDHPTDTMLSGMKIGPILKPKTDRNLTSWQTKSDPSQGKYVLSIDPIGVPQLVIRNADTNNWIWRGGPWNGYSFSGACPKKSFSIGLYRDFDQIFSSSQDQISFYFNMINDAISTMTLDENGVVRLYEWKPSSRSRSLVWLAPRDACDFFPSCGANAICDSGGSPMCVCLDGFGPRNLVRWGRGDWSDGCVRMEGIGCRENGTDDFVVVRGTTLPDTREAMAEMGLGLEECKTRCLMNCSCEAFATLRVSGAESGCIIWLGEVRDIGVSSDNRQDLYIRVASQTPNGSNGRSKKRPWFFVVISVASVMFLLMILMCTFIIRRSNHEDEQQSISSRNWNHEIMHELDAGKEGNLEILFFKYAQVVSATDNFSDSNKLGEGGFGPVYKGKLPDGQDVAIKRLSARSGQGLEEFKNEIILIAKLQHRNLVRLLGCCIRGEEKMLIYEYMSNKSLDIFLFDVKRRLNLSWERRIQIIEGIVQGLVYLHKHSRLRIIHRDLKASNILLDADMNPKISDFGMARIFYPNDTEKNTERIVGTFGYMSPEYALNGIFSVKSDVYSFGVLLLEIVSGKKNHCFHEYNPWGNLVAYAWSLWKDGTWKKLIDPSLEHKFELNDVAKCIYVALLCVQERPEDRPFMSDVATMLNSQSLYFNSVKKPAFFTIENASDLEWRSNQYENDCSNRFSISTLSGR